MFHDAIADAAQLPQLLPEATPSKPGQAAGASSADTHRTTVIRVPDEDDVHLVHFRYLDLQRHSSTDAQSFVLVVFLVVGLQ